MLSGDISHRDGEGLAGGEGSIDIAVRKPSSIQAETSVWLSELCEVTHELLGSLMNSVIPQGELW